jgi:hypothetical protein
MLCLSAAPVPALAYDFFGGANCGRPANDQSVACSTQAHAGANGNPNPLTGSDGLLAHITTIVAYAAGAAAIIVIIVSALRFITSGSDVSTGSRTDTDVEDARRSIVGAIIGLIVIVLAHTLIIYILDRL